MDSKFLYALIGFAGGLLVALVVYVVTALKASSAKKELRAEIIRYKNMVSDRMEAESDTLSKLRSELEESKKENENLRVALNIASSKPDAKEVIRASILQHTADKLTLSSPGFAPIWAQALKESEDEYQNKILTGKVSIFKKLFSKKSFSSDSTKAIEDKEENQ